MNLLTKILDAVQPPRGLTGDEFRAFRKSLVPTKRCNMPMDAQINETEDYIELCMRPKDLARWRFNLAENGLGNNQVVGEIFTEMTTNPEVKIRFRHWYVSTVSDSISESVVS